jgi:hypothetical protein
MLEAVCISETLVYFNETTQQYIPESCHFHTCCHNNLKSYIILIIFQLFVAAMGTHGGGSNEISGRFTRHMFIVCIDSFEDKTLEKIFCSIMDWHFAKGFDANIARLSKVCTENVLGWSNIQN